MYRRKGGFMLIIGLSILFIILNIIDVILTNKILLKGGLELNPIIKWLMSKVGDRWGYYKIFFITILCLSGVYYIHSDFSKLTIIILIIINIGYSYIIWNNWKESRKGK